MSYRNWKHILTAFSFHNSIFNGIFVIKITYGSTVKLFALSNRIYLFFFMGLGHTSLYSPLLLFFFFSFLFTFGFGSFLLFFSFHFMGLVLFFFLLFFSILLFFFSSFLFFSPSFFFFQSFFSFRVRWSCHCCWCYYCYCCHCWRSEERRVGKECVA